MISSHSSLEDVFLVPTLQFASGPAPLYLSSIISPPPYSRPNPAPRQSPTESSTDQADQDSQVYDRDNHASTAGGPVYTIHTYGLEEYAYVFINSHADSPQDTPVLYQGEQTTGTIQFSHRRLQEVQSIVVVLQVFDSDTVNPTSVTKLVLLPGQNDPYQITNGGFCEHFAITPPTTAHDSGLKFELQITIHRRGRFNRKIRMKQPIMYSTRPDSPSLSPPPQIPARNPRNLPSSWKASNYPGLVVRGDVFQQYQVEVECRLIIPNSYPVCDEVPLHLVMTCVDRMALELFSISDAINVRLLQVLAFGKKAATASPPFTLRNRKSHLITKWVAKAHWYADSECRELPPDDWCPYPRWRTKLNGELRREPGAEISHSFVEPGMAIKYYVCLFPFHTPDFRPICNSDKVLFYGQIVLSR